MKSLLAIEWLKIKKYRTFWILTGFFALLLPLWNYGISEGALRMGASSVNILSQAYSFDYVWENVGFWASIFVMFISILMIIITTNEYQYRTNRQNVIDGWTRLDFYHAKWHMVILLSILTTLYVFLVGVWFGSNNGGEFPGNIRKLGYLFVLSVNYYSFALLLAIFFKRSGIAIGIFFLYSLIIENMVKGFVNWRFDTSAGNYLPLQCSDELLPFPLMDAMKMMMKMKDAPSEFSYLVASAAWIGVYYLIGKVKLERSDW